MESGNVREFVNNLLIQNEIVRLDNHIYYFYGVRYDYDKQIYCTGVDQFGKSLYDFEKNFYYYENKDPYNCFEHLISDRYWNSKDFYEVEDKMK